MPSTETATAETAPALPLVRTQSRGTIALGVGLVAMGVVAVWFYFRGGPAWGAIFLVLLGLAVVSLVNAVRYRLTVDERGIARRGLVRETFVPWDEVEGLSVLGGNAGAVQITRRTKGPLVVTHVPPAVVPEMRAMAGLPVPDEPPPRYLARLRLRALCWVVPALVVALALLTIRRFHDGFGSVSATLLGLVLAGIFTRSLLIVLFGRTEAGNGGVRNRLAVLVKQIPWTAVQRLEVVPTPFGRRVVLVSPPIRIALAAPRESLFARDPGFDAGVEELAARSRQTVEVKRRSGLLRLSYPLLLAGVVLALLWSEKPQLEPWWPGNTEATAIPDACPVGQDVAGRLVARPKLAGRARRDLGYVRTSVCEWREQGTALGLTLRYTLFPRDGGDSGTARAVTRMNSARSLGGAPVRGLGDQAHLRDGEATGGSDIALTVRRQNVLLEVEYSGRRPVGQARPEAETLARRALARVRFV
ncbi:PH domain-containing protein [Spirillospora sp. CA-294931]|uniref:PH domain-containing protein n=1 Tax=Spirillospora sp. CA-294931 TaxID=3240042 RepID=UPI003D8C4D70